MSASVRPYYWLLGLSMMFTHSILGQTYVLLNNETLLPFEKSLNKPGLNFHPGIKPYDNNEISQLIDIDSVFSSKNHFPNLFKINKEKRDLIGEICLKDFDIPTKLKSAFTRELNKI